MGLAFIFSAQAADTYDATKSTLTIPLVKVGEAYYSDVIITLGKVVSVGSASSSYLSYDTYTAASNQLAIPQVIVGGITYYNAVVTVGNVLSVGGTCASLAACTSSSAATDAIYYAPAPFTSILQTSYQPASLVPASSFVTRSRYMISDAATTSTASNYLSIGSTYSATAGYTVESGTVTNASTYNTYLSKLVLAVSDSSGNFRFDSHLHPNNSIDCDTSDANKLKFRNNFGKASLTYGYVSFSYDPITKLLQAKKRYKYSYSATTYAMTYTEETTFAAANYYVMYDSGAYKLVADSASATRLYLYASPIDLGIPSDFNPTPQSYVTNGAAPFNSNFSPSSIEGTSGSIYRKVNSKYQNQLSVVGASAVTKKNADAMLASIKTTVESMGEKLRYSTGVYTVFRDAALATTLASDSIADGTPGQNMVPYIWFTNEQDSSGSYHPFMVVVSYINQASPNGLIDVPHPPGSGSGGYGESNVTRFSNLGFATLRIPMKDYGVVSVVTENTMTTTLLSDMSTTTQTADVYNYASRADNGVLIDGSVTFPAYNNVLVPSQSAGELSPSGCHVGQGGGGPHCHADGYQSGKGWGLYNDSDYVGKTHPPLIGFGYDGLALFGIYRPGTDAAMLGYSTALDSFGAHNHDSVGYHFHAHTVPNYVLSGSTTYTLHVLMKGAYIGKTNSVPCFLTCASTDANKYTYGS